MCTFEEVQDNWKDYMPFAEVECLRDAGVQCARDGPCARFIQFCLPSWELTYPLKSNIEDYVSFAKGGHVSSLEGN